METDFRYDGKKYELEDSATHILVSRPIEKRGSRKVERRINIYTRKGVIIIKLSERMYTKLKSQVAMNIRMDKGDFSDIGGKRK